MKGCGMKKMAKGGQTMCSPRKQMAMGMKAGGIMEYGGKEKYSSKAAMKRHEKMESPAMEKKEKKMMGGGMVKGYKYGGTAKKGKKAC